MTRAQPRRPGSGRPISALVWCGTRGSEPEVTNSGAATRRRVGTTPPTQTADPDHLGATMPLPPTTTGPMRRTEFPALFLAASDSSGRGQRRYKRLIAAELVSLVIGAALAVVIDPMTAGLFNGDRTPEAIAVAMPFLAALGFKFANHNGQHDAEWFDGRAVAETVRSQSWRYMMRAEPYDAPESDAAFLKDLTAVLRARPKLSEALDSLPEHPNQITMRMRGVRGLSVGNRRDFYVEQRLDDQVDWYRSKSLASQVSAGHWFWASTSAEVVGASIALLSLMRTDLDLVHAVGLCATLAAAWTAWSQLNRHAELSKSYALACQELLVITSLAAQVKRDDQLGALVQNGEGAISREHTMWIAKRGDPLPP
jgi:hypothetical protein